MFGEMEKINRRPKPFEFYTAEALWNDDHISKKMLEYHLKEDVDLASRNMAFIDRSVRWMTSRFDIGPDTRICDFGCGPGLYTSRFARAGAQVTGVDFSGRSIHYANERAKQDGLRVDYVLKNYLEFSSDKRFDLITMIYVDYCPLSPRQRANLLDVFQRHLAEGGAVFLDVLTLNHFDSVEESRSYEHQPDGGFWSPEAYYMFLNIFKYDTEKVILNKHTVVEKKRTREIFNWLQCFNTESLARELDAGGFGIVEQYGDVAGTPFKADAPQMAVVAKRKP